MINTLIYLLTIVGVFFSIRFFIKLIKNEKMADVFRQNLRKGDKVSFHVMQSQRPEGEILDLDPLGDGEFVKITTVVPKRFIYP
jgi:hypothetical protein